MKVIAINGSPRVNGNTSTALRAMTDELERQGIETETIQIGNKNIRGCIACGHCAKSEGNRCVFTDDGVNEIAQKLRDMRARNAAVAVTAAAIDPDPQTP